MDERVAGAGRLDPHDDGQLLVQDPDPPRRVLGDVAVPRDDHDDRLADVVDLVLRKGVAGAGVGQRGVGDEHGQGLGDPAGQVVPRVDRLDAVDLPGVADLDVDDARVGVRAAHERRGQCAVPEVVEVATVAGEQSWVLAALHPLAELPGAHRATSLSLPSGVPESTNWSISVRRISAARQTARTMFW